MSFSYPDGMTAAIEESYQALSSCEKPSHFHHWPTSGELEIERCEHYCLFCRGPRATKKWSSAWFLRRHVRETHAKTEYPGLTVSEGWSKCPNGNARPICKKQRAPGSNKKRIGTKKDRAALIKSLQSGNFDFSMSALPEHTASLVPPTHASSEMLQGQQTFASPVITSTHSMPAPTAIMHSSATDQQCSQPVDPTPYFPSSTAPSTLPMPEPSADFEFHDWVNTTTTAASQCDIVAPEELELFPDLSQDSTMTDASSFESELFDFDGYSQTIDPHLVDSTLGTSVPSITDDAGDDAAAKEAGLFTPHNGLSADEVDLGNQLMVALQDDTLAQPVDTVASSDNCYADPDAQQPTTAFNNWANTSHFDDTFFGAQFDDFDADISSFESFVSDPAFANMLAADQ